MAGRPVNRVPPKLDPKYNVTYQLHAPASTHWRKATCAEVDCPAHLRGWRLRVEGLTPADAQAVKDSRRKYTVLRVAQGETYLVFEAGQACFRADTHRVRVERPEIYVARGGDWRRYTAGHRAFGGRNAAADWVDSFAENQNRITAIVARG